MTFTSLEFPLFFLVVLALNHWTRRLSTWRWVLLVASYVFYVASGVYGVALLVFTSFVDYQVGRRLGLSTDAAIRKRWLFVSLATNLGALAFFKYANFGMENINAGLDLLGARLPLPTEIILPVGISYFTFSGISYIVDVYDERLEPCRDVSEYLLYVAYFPKILAGPIVRAPDLLTEFREGSRATAADVEVGCAYFLLGAVKKLVIADQLAGHVGLIFDDPAKYDAATLLQGIIGYTVQIYCDFSGYSDMAIGCARMMGIRFPQNFLMPYSSVNITEFWRRWHVTLSTWFRDYVFLRLEFANRNAPNATVRMACNLVLTMLLCGLWHGASWSFVFWGGLHGLSLALHRVWRALYPSRPGTPRKGESVRILASRALTLGVVMLGWVFFRAKTWSLALIYLEGLFTWRDGIRLGSPYILPLSTLVLVVHLLVGKERNLAEEIDKRPALVRVGAYSTAVLTLTLLVPADTVPFVYFQF